MKKIVFTSHNIIYVLPTVNAIILSKKLFAKPLQLIININGPKTEIIPSD